MWWVIGWLVISVSLATPRPATTRFVGVMATDGCSSGLVPGDTLRLSGVTLSNRPLGEVRIWVDTINRFRYALSWRQGATRFQWDGGLDVSPSGIPLRFDFRWREGNNHGLELVEQIGDSIVVVRDTTRRAAPLPPNVAPFPQSYGAPLMAILAQCVLAQKELLTARYGVLRATQAATLTLQTAGRAELVRLIAISSDSAPSLGRVWLDARGRVFALLDADWAGGAIRSDWVDHYDQLRLAELRAAEPRMRETARALGLASPGGVAFRNVRLVDLERGSIQENMTVFVKGSRIETVRRDSGYEPPVGVRVVEGGGKTLLPGLWDLNQGANISWGGLNDRGTRSLLSRGVTGMMDMTGDTLVSPVVLQRIATGNQIAPRVVAACSVQGWLPDSIGSTVPPWLWEHGQVRDQGDLRRIVSRCRSAGVQWLYLRRTFPSELVAAAIAIAHDSGLRISGQSLHGGDTRTLLTLGLDAFAHAGDALYPFAGLDPDPNAWLLGREGGMESHWSTGARLAELDLTTTQIRQAIALFAQRKAAVVTTLCVMPPANRVTRPHDTTYDAASFAKLKEFVALLRKEGATVLAGTDGGCTLARELELLQDIGYTNAELLKLVTVDAARFAGLEQETGTIAVGRLADLILVDGDPLTRIRDLERVNLVMKDGLLYTDLVALRASLPFLPRNDRMRQHEEQWIGGPSAEWTALRCLTRIYCRHAASN